MVMTMSTPQQSVPVNLITTSQTQPVPIEVKETMTQLHQMYDEIKEVSKIQLEVIRRLETSQHRSNTSICFNIIYWILISPTQVITYLY